MTLDRMLIAVVDDDDHLRRALKRALTISGFEVESYGTSDEFLKSLAYHAPACVILDFQLHDGTALSVLEQLNQMGSKAPVIVLTAYDDPALKEQCMSAGAVDFLAKPISRESLVAAIHRTTSHPLRDC